jgi:hypothetical protein
MRNISTQAGSGGLDAHQIFFAKRPAQCGDGAKTWFAGLAFQALMGERL